MLNYLRKAGFSDANIFEFFMHQVVHSDPHTLPKLDGTPLKQFLTRFIKSNPTYKPTLPAFATRYNPRNDFYFEIMEEADPSQAVGFIIKQVADNPTSLIYFQEYKQGHYFKELVSTLQNGAITSQEDAEEKFKVVIELYKIYPAEYASLGSLFAKRYLQYLFSNNTRSWEHRVQLESIGYVPLSACAVHFLLRSEKDAFLDELRSWFTNRQFLPIETLYILHQELGKAALPFLLMALQNEAQGLDSFKRLLDLLQVHFAPEDYTPVLWGMAGTKQKPLKLHIAGILTAKDLAAVDKAIGLLESKSGEARQTAALILRNFPTPPAVAAVHKALQKETNDNARDILLETVADSLEEQATSAFVQNMIAAAGQRGKLDKPLVKWLDEKELPLLYYKDGNPLQGEAIRFLLYRMSRIKSMRSDAEAKLLLNYIDKERSGDFAKRLLLLFIEKGEKSDQKYLLALAALLGSDGVVDKMRATINKWLDESRKKMAEYGIGALAIQGSDKALRWVEWYSRKYRNKKEAIAQAAIQALDDAAEELGITTHELGDRIVPDFGFEGLFRHFMVGNDEYRAFIDGQFKLAFFDENNKKLKSIPSAASADLKDEFKNIGKEVRDIVKSQSPRLKHYLVVQRSWPMEQWQAFFLNNPVMFIYATRLLWGIYIDGQLKECFLCQEDTTLVDVTDDEITLPENASIRIVHPLYLSAEMLQAWKRRFFDLSLEPIFPQLERVISRPDDTLKGQKIIHHYLDKSAEPGSIRGTLERHGWRKGSSGDGGTISAFHYQDYESQVEAVLETRGVYATGFSHDYDPSLGRLYFLSVPKKKNEWFREPDNESDERLIALGEVSPVFYSEVISAVEAIKLKAPVVTR